MKDKILTLPNLLTFLRLPLAILVIIYPVSIVSYVILLCAFLLDFLDGYVAKHYNMSSKLGAILDPVFDRILVVIIFVYFYARLDLSVYYILLFFARDIITVSVGAILLLTKLNAKVEIKAKFLGKVVTVLQFVVLLLIVHGDLTLIIPGIYITFIVSIVALADYLIYFINGLKKDIDIAS